MSDAPSVGVNLVGTKPATDARSKQVMLRAEYRDTVEVTAWVSGGRGDGWPDEYTVTERKTTYFGPVLTLHAAVDGEDQQYRLTCPGPDTQLVLWKALLDNEGFIKSYHPIAEVRAKIVDVEQYFVCDHCGEPIQTAWHERLSAFGECENVDDPNGYGGHR